MVSRPKNCMINFLDSLESLTGVVAVVKSTEIGENGMRKIKEVEYIIKEQK